MLRFRAEPVPTRTPSTRTEPYPAAHPALASRTGPSRGVAVLAALALALTSLLAIVTLRAPAAKASTPGATALAWGKTQEGKPYQYGGTGPNSYDCSGLTMVSYSHAGITLPRTSDEQYASTTSQAVSLTAMQPGDLMFFGSSGATVHHVGMFDHYGANGHPYMLDSPEDGYTVGIHDAYYYGDLLAASRPYTVQALPPPPPPPPPAPGPQTSTALGADFDHDGRGDLAAFTEPSAHFMQLWVWLSTTSRGGTPRSTPKYLVGTGPGMDADRMQVAVGDVTGDGRPDIVAMTDRHGGVTAFYVWRNTGTPGHPSFAAPVQVFVGTWPGWSTSSTRLTLADLDGDHRADIVVFGPKSGGGVGAWAFRSTSAGTRSSVSSPSLIWSRSDWSISHVRVFAGDMAGSGRDDLMAMYDLGGGYVKVWFMRAVGGMQVANRVLIRQGIDPGWSVNSVQPLAADLTGDGRAEMFAFVGTPQGEQLYAWPTVGPRGQAPTPVGRQLLWAYDWAPSRTMPFATDVDGDGRADIGAFYDNGGEMVRSWLWRSTGWTGRVVVAPRVMVQQTEGAGFSARAMAAL